MPAVVFSRVIIVSLVAASLVAPGAAEDKPKPPEPKKPTVMQRKLAHAQKLLESLALDDFAKMDTCARELQLCAKEASWQIVKKPKYETYSNDFVRQLDAIRAAAKKNNTDAAALAFVEMTLTCVKCHQFVREEGVGITPDLSLFGPKAVAVK
jgi:hypothetical protein